MAAGRRRRIGAPLSRRGYLITSVTTFAVLLAIWTLVTVSGLVPPIFLPSPGAVLTALGEQLQNGELAADTAASVYRITVGFLAATVMAVPRPMTKVEATPAQNRPCASAKTSTRMAPEQGRSPTAMIADSPRRQPPLPASCSGSGPCEWPQ